MRVYEIVKEDRQQVDEAFFLALPILGSVTFGGIMAAVSAVLTVMDIVEIYKLSSKLAKNPESMTEDDYATLFVDIIFMLPALKYVPKAAKGMISKAIPDSWKKAGGQKVKDIIQSKASKADGKGSTKIDPKTGKPEEKPTKGKGAGGTIAATALGGLTGAAAVDYATGGKVFDKAKSTIGGAIDKVTGGATNLGGNRTVDGDTMTKDDPLYKYARWFGRTQ